MVRGEDACPECQSQDVRPSRSSYTLDKERIGEDRKSFWRCGHCGCRFLGPLVMQKKRRSQRARVHDPLGESLGVSRMAKRWVFPLIVLLLTALIVGVILDLRNRPSAPPAISPWR